MECRLGSFSAHNNQRILLPPPDFGSAQLLPPDPLPSQPLLCGQITALVVGTACKWLWQHHVRVLGTNLRPPRRRVPCENGQGASLFFCLFAMPNLRRLGRFTTSCTRPQIEYANHQEYVDQVDCDLVSSHYTPKVRERDATDARSKRMELFAPRKLNATAGARKEEGSREDGGGGEELGGMFSLHEFAVRNACLPACLPQFLQQGLRRCRAL